MRFNGSIKGKDNTPTISSASGIWGLREQSLYRREGEWPIVPVDLSSDILLFASFNGTNGDTTADVYSGDGTVSPLLVSDGILANGSSSLSNVESQMVGYTTSGYTPASSGSDYWEVISAVNNNMLVGSSSPISFEFWWYNSGFVSSSYSRLLAFDGYFTSGSGIEIESNSTNTSSWIFYEFTGSANNRSSRGTYTMGTNQWHHIYWAIDPTGGPSYVGINGTVSTFSNYLSSFSPTVPLTLGGLGTGDSNNRSSRGYFQHLVVRNTIPYTSNFTPSTTPLL